MVNPVAAADTPGAASAATTANPFHVAPADVQQAQMASAQPQAAAPTNSAENSAGPAPDGSVPANTNISSSAQAATESTPITTTQSTARGKEKSVASTSKRPRDSRNATAYSDQRRIRS